jgi:hypothetical protein
VQIGAENKTKVRVAMALGAAAALVLAYQFLGYSNPPSSHSPVRPVARQAPQAGRLGKGKRTANLEERLDPTLDLKTLAATEDMKYSGTGRNIFVASVNIPTPVARVNTDKAPTPGPPVPTGPPPPPPIPLKFFGFASKPGEPKRIFLAQGEDVFIASEGDIVNRRYKVLHIGPTSVDIEDVLYNNRQSIPLTQG